jgi:hypothetical protein
LRVTDFLGIEKVIETLSWLDANYGVLEKNDTMQAYGCLTAQETLHLLSNMANVGLTHDDGDYVHLTTTGKRTLLLLRALDGQDLAGVWRQLCVLYPSLHRYELVTEGMTRMFIDSLYSRPEAAHIFICSPWLDMDSSTRCVFVEAISRCEQATRRKPEILALTRPVTQTGNWPALADTVDWLMSLGIEVVFYPNLHSKLYIRQPGSAGTFSMAILGSQNLTKGRNIELGIQVVNDSEIIRKLTGYFFQLFATCTE